MTRTVRTRPGVAALALVLAVGLTLAGCGGSGGDARTVTLVTHDSFVMSKALRRRFTEQTGWKLRILKNGDAGAALNQVILTEDAPLGDAFFGVDTTFLTRALDRQVFARYRPAGLDRTRPSVRLDPSGHATPVDFGDVCVNADRAAFADTPMPETLDDLADPRYRDMLVVENPATSSPGLAFVAATVAAYGDRWLDYWDRLRANGVLVVDGWEQAYNGEFSGAAGGGGDRPLVVSYASSPPAEVYFADPQPATAPTANLDRTCFRQVEFAGVLRGAAHPAGARALVDFMLGDAFQRALPLSMFVFPAVRDTLLPDVFTRFASVPADPYRLSPGRIGRDRETWIDRWTEHVLR
jgi:thiamine transport system substrate-binding protein